MKKYFLGVYKILLMTFLMGVVFYGLAFAAEPTGEYLQYQDVKPAAYSSGLSMITYIFSLLVTFGLVIGLAYFASRYMGVKMGKAAVNGHQKILDTLPLGTNRAVYIVEIAGKCLVLGVTDHAINVLQEITDSREIQNLKATPLSEPDNQFEKVFQRQLASLQRLSPKFPNVFQTHQQNEEKHEDEKR